MKLNLKPDRRLLRQFAWASLFLFPAIGGFLGWKYGLPTTWVVVLCAIGVLVGIVELVLVPVAGSLGATLESAVTRPIYVGMSVVAFPIGFVISQALMLLIYLLVMTPIALVFRLIGRDALGRKLDSKQVSYWHERSATRDASSYFKLY